MRNTAGGPLPLVNSEFCSALSYEVLEKLWVVMVPLPSPSNGAIPAVGSAKAGTQQVIPQVTERVVSVLRL
jgi:hypothetical protein